MDQGALVLKLRKHERCPICNLYKCAHRPELERKRRSAKGWERIANGVRRIADSTVPGGYRYKLSPAIKREILLRRIREQEGVCALFQVRDTAGDLIAPECPGKFTDLQNVTLDHKEPRGMNGSRYDDGRLGENLHAVHHNPCNQVKGSRRIA